MNELLYKVKQNLMITHDSDDELINGLVLAAVSYAEGYQHVPAGYYTENEMSPTTTQGVVMMASHLYESRDGSTGGFWNDNVNAADKSWQTVERFLRMDRDWKV